MSGDLHSVVVNGVVFNGDKVLVSQRSYKEAHEGGKWTIPGGKVEASEIGIQNILEKTVAREIKEETGVEVFEQMSFVVNNSFIRPSDNQHVIVIVFKCNYKSGEPTPLDDTINCKWVSKEEIEKMEFPPNVQNYILKAF